MGKIVQEATAVARLASQGGWGKEPPPSTILKSPGAVQGQRRLPSSPPQAAAPGDEWARVGRQLASAWELDGLVHAGGDRGLAGGAGRARPGAGSPWDSPLAILTALTRRTVFRLALRQTEGLIGSILHLLGLELAVPDHPTLRRRAARLRVPRPRAGTGPLQLLVDSTGLRLGGPGEGLVEKHGATTRRCWRKLHLGVDAGTGRIEAVELTGNETDDGSRVGPLLDQVEAAPVASFTGDGAWDRKDVSGVVAERHPAAAVVVPPRQDAVPSATAATAPTRRDRHLRLIAGRGRLGWRKASGYHRRALAEVAISRCKRVMGDTLRSRTDGRSSGHRGHHGRPCPEPHARARPPGVRPHRVNPNGGWGPVRPSR